MMEWDEERLLRRIIPPNFFLFEYFVTYFFSFFLKFAGCPIPAFTVLKVIIVPAQAFASLSTGVLLVLTPLISLIRFGK